MKSYKLAKLETAFNFSNLETEQESSAFMRASFQFVKQIVLEDWDVSRAL
jgi:hypothetical protein